MASSDARKHVRVTCAGIGVQVQGGKTGQRRDDVLASRRWTSTKARLGCLLSGRRVRTRNLKTCRPLLHPLQTATMTSSLLSGTKVVASYQPLGQRDPGTASVGAFDLQLPQAIISYHYASPRMHPWLRRRLLRWLSRPRRRAEHPEMVMKASLAARWGPGRLLSIAICGADCRSHRHGSRRAPENGG